MHDLSKGVIYVRKEYKNIEEASVKLEMNKTYCSIYPKASL